MSRILRSMLLFALLAVLSGCVTNPSTGRSQLILFTSNEISAMGQEATPQVLGEFGGEVESEALKRYINEVGQRVAAHVEPEYADLEWKFYVLESDVVNAFALPGGNTFITRGLLQHFTNEAQVAGVLGHEIGHVTGRHTDERLSQAVLTQGLLEVVNTSTESELVVIGAGLLSQGVMLNYSRDHEYESDWQGLKYMTRAGYDPMGMVEVLEVLDSLAQGGRPPEFLSTHPHPENRIEEVRSMIKRDYAFTQGSSDYRKFPKRFKTEALPHLGDPG